MGRTEEITDKDREVLLLIDKAGVVSFSQIKGIYGSSWYPYKRTSVLLKRGYIKKDKDGCYILTPKGAAVIGKTTYRIRNGTLKKKRLEVTDIIQGLSKWNRIPVREVIHKYSLNRGIMFQATIEKDGREYAVYVLSPKTHQDTIKRIMAEMKYCATFTKMTRSIIFVPPKSNELLSYFDKHTCDQDEIFILPYPRSIPVLNEYFDNDIQHFLVSLMPEDAKLTSYQYADYETPERLFTYLVLPDIVKIEALKIHLAVNPSKKPTIICLQSQQKYYSSLFPATEFILLEEKLFFDRTGNPQST